MKPQKSFRDELPLVCFLALAALWLGALAAGAYSPGDNLKKLQKTRQKYMDMYTDDLISREELNGKIGGMKQEIERLENELKMVSYNLTKGEQLESILNSTFQAVDNVADVRQMTNAQLKRIIQKIEADKDGNVDIYLRLLGDLGLDETVLICNDHTQGRLLFDTKSGMYHSFHQSKLR